MLLGKYSTDEFLAGWTAAFINTTVLFPVNKLIFRQMAGGMKTRFAAGQMSEEGLRYLYRGILPPLMQKMVSVSIMFGSFGHYKAWTDNKMPNSPHVVNLSVAACLTGATEAFLTPLERVQMLLQDPTYHKDYKNTIDALVKLKRFGFNEYYRGLTCVLLRNGPSNILFFGLRDEVKLAMPKLPAKFSHDSVYNFLSGALLGMFISTLFYPLSVVRTRMQTRAPGTKMISIVRAFNDVYRERDKKFVRLFHGCLINVCRQFLSWGLINCSYEWALKLLHSY